MSVKEAVTEFLELQDQWRTQEGIADAARAKAQSIKDTIEQRERRPTDFGVGRTAPEAYYKLEDGSIVRVIWRSPTVGTGDGTAEVRRIKVEVPRG